MLIHVDGQADRIPRPGATLGAVVSELRRSAGSRRLVISEITLDGELLTAQREEEYAVRPAADFSSLEARVSAPEELIRDTFAGLARILPALEAQAAEAARELRGGSPPGGTLMELAEALDFVLGAYGEGVSVLEDAPLPQGALQAMGEVLCELLLAIDAKDTARLCDALEHEFGPALAVLGEEIGGFLAAPLAEGGPAGEGEARA